MAVWRSDERRVDAVVVVLIVVAQADDVDAHGEWVGDVIVLVVVVVVVLLLLIDG